MVYLWYMWRTYKNNKRYAIIVFILCYDFARDIQIASNVFAILILIAIISLKTLSK